MTTLQTQKDEAVSCGKMDSFTDIKGLLIDWLELLDPEILAASPDSSITLVFGCSDTEQLSKSLLASVSFGGKKQEAASSSSLKFSPYLLLSGQGYLQDRLANNSSWPTHFSTMAALLNADNMKDWSV